MSYNKVVRTELDKLAGQIETLARTVRQKLSGNEVVVDVANELIKNSVSFTFHLGQLYGLEVPVNQPVASSAKSVKSVKVVSQGNSQARYHNVRDSRGRFARTTTVVSNP